MIGYPHRWEPYPDEQTFKYRKDIPKIPRFFILLKWYLVKWWVLRK